MSWRALICPVYSGRGKVNVPDSNLELARAFVGLWNAGERSLGDRARCCDPDVELRSPFSSVVGEPYRGHAGVQRWAQDVDDQFSRWSLMSTPPAP